MVIGEIKKTGGARIGIARATWPFATLTVNKNIIRLNAGIIGDLVFGPSDVISIEPYSLPMSQGIKIRHSVGGYNPDVVFLTFSPGELINEIQQTGFLDNKSAVPINREIAALQDTGGFPLKWPPVIAIVLIWNVLFMANFYNNFSGNKKTFGFGIEVKIAFAFIFLISLSLLFVKPVQEFMLKKGRTIQSIRPFLYFLLFIVGMMLLVSTVLPS